MASIARFPTTTEGLALALTLAVAFTLAGPAGCQTEGEAARAQARVRQEEWRRQARAISTQEAALRERLGRLAAPGPGLAPGPGAKVGPGPGAGAVAAGATGEVPARVRAARLRAEALLAGSRQSLADLEIAMKQAAARIEASATAAAAGQEGRGEGERATAVLEQEDARVMGVLHMLGEQLASAEKQIAELAKS